MADIMETNEDNSPVSIDLDNVFHLNGSEGTDDDTNKKRIKRILDTYKKRNETHAKYFNYTEFKPRLLVEDATLYDALSDIPILKRFLLNDKPIITKKFFEFTRVFLGLNFPFRRTLNQGVQGSNP